MNLETRLKNNLSHPGMKYAAAALAGVLSIGGSSYLTYHTLFASGTTFSITSALAPPYHPPLPLHKEKLGLQEIYDKYNVTIDSASRTYGIPVSLIVASIYVESRGDPYAISCTGAAGLMQLTVDTAAAMGVTPGNYNLVTDPEFSCAGQKHWISTREGCNAVDTAICDYHHDDRFDPDKNIVGGTKNLKLKFDAKRNWKKALTDNGGGDVRYYAKVWKAKKQFEVLRRHEDAGNLLIIH